MSVNRAYGLTAEVNNKIAGQYDKGLEAEVFLFLLQPFQPLSSLPT